MQPIKKPKQCHIASMTHLRQIQQNKCWLLLTNFEEIIPGCHKLFPERQVGPHGRGEEDDDWGEPEHFPHRQDELLGFLSHHLIQTAHSVLKHHRADPCVTTELLDTRCVSLDLILACWCEDVWTFLNTKLYGCCTIWHSCNNVFPHSQAFPSLKQNYCLSPIHFHSMQRTPVTWILWALQIQIKHFISTFICFDPN